MSVLESKLSVTTIADLYGRGGADEPVTLRFDPADPVVVQVRFNNGEYRNGDGYVPEWGVARQLLAAGGGSMDVKVDRSVDALILTLSSSDGTCRISMPTGKVDAFLARTYEVVPLGEEVNVLHLDALVAELLGSAP